MPSRFLTALVPFHWNRRVSWQNIFDDGVKTKIHGPSDALYKALHFLGF